MFFISGKCIKRNARGVVDDIAAGTISKADTKNLSSRHPPLIFSEYVKQGAINDITVLGEKAGLFIKGIRILRGENNSEVASVPVYLSKATWTPRSFTDPVQCFDVIKELGITKFKLNIEKWDYEDHRTLPDKKALANTAKIIAIGAAIEEVFSSEEKEDEYLTYIASQFLETASSSFDLSGVAKDCDTSKFEDLHNTYKKIYGSFRKEGVSADNSPHGVSAFERKSVLANRYTLVKYVCEHAVSKGRNDNEIIQILTDIAIDYEYIKPRSAPKSKALRSWITDANPPAWACKSALQYIELNKLQIPKKELDLASYASVWFDAEGSFNTVDQACSRNPRWSDTDCLKISRYIQAEINHFKNSTQFIKKT